MNDYYTIEPCASSRAFEIILKGKRIDIEKTSGVNAGKIIAKTPVVLVLNLNGKSVSIYASGRIMLKEVTKNESKKLAEEIMKKLENGGCID